MDINIPQSVQDTILLQEASPSSYYAIFDGHAGHTAAAYSAAHLHQFLAESEHFPSNVPQALQEAFCKTDALFLEKIKLEVRRFLKDSNNMICKKWHTDFSHCLEQCISYKLQSNIQDYMRKVCILINVFWEVRRQFCFLHYKDLHCTHLMCN